ncbi:TPA: hypothetical protein ACSVPQ_004219 [Clostridioides difficile]|uniref:hypothetical protein n=1 Tax=Clostridioides difficile TaxID=1496 RepID=UPI0020B1A14C|nr:hypothetical protein [Clostridioides difficile]MCE4651541.1 hypothetical protein [Clostridioides difficile]MDV9301278.1 hypothetical protein [Clostridioides difficile]
MVCKLNHQAQVFSLHLHFILTMWYVNTAPKTYNESVTSGFILTMWYVKISTSR